MTGGKAVVALAALALMLALASPSWGRDDDDAPAAGPTQKPQLRSPEVNAARAVGEDELEGPSIFEGVPALNPIDAARDRLRAAGVSLYGVYLGDPYGVLSGGVRRGGTYSGRLDVEGGFRCHQAVRPAGGHLSRQHVPDPRRGSLSSTHIGNILSINRHRRAAQHAPLRGLVRAALRQARVAPSRPAGASMSSS